MFQTGNIAQGPYRATKLWNEAVRLFQAGMPTKKHWHLLKAYPDTFSGNEAADWLHDLLKINNNFGQQVTKMQTIQLLRKFLKNHVIEDLNGKWGSEQLSDNGQLFRFPVGVSPSKAIRQPLALLNLNKHSPRRQSIQDAKKKFLVQSTSQYSKKPEKMDKNTIASVWKTVLSTSLQRVLHLSSVDEFLKPHTFHPDWLIKNASTNQTPSTTDHEMPYWVISAMQCLATWPDSENSGLPNYPGFEKDVFAAVCGYFQALTEPILTFNLYQLFVSVLVRAEMLDQVCTNDTHHTTQDKVEKLRKQLLQAQMRHENKAIRRHRSIRVGSSQPKRLEFDQTTGYSSLPRRKTSKQDGFSTWKLEDVATREKWTQRFQSVQALDALSEAASFDGDNEHISSREQPSSLPTSDDFSLKSRCWCSEWTLNTRKGNDERYNSRSLKTAASTDNIDDLELNLGFLNLEDEGQSASVENLLLDMSYTMRKEMEDALMEDSPVNKLSSCSSHNYKPCHSQDEDIETVYDEIASPRPCSLGQASEEDRSWWRRTAGPVSDCHKFKEPMAVELGQKYRHSFRVKRKSSATRQENVYMDMVPNNNNYCSSNMAGMGGAWNYSMAGTTHASEKIPAGVTTLDGPAKLRRQNSSRSHDGVHDPTHSSNSFTFHYPKSKKVRRTLKPTQEELEYELMSSGNNGRKPLQEGNGASKYPGLKSASFSEKLNKCQPKPSCPSIDRKSDIKARCEVPPTITAKTIKTNPHYIKERIMRLPYVSESIANSNSLSSEDKNSESNFARLCRSHSSLSHRRPNKKYLKPNLHHGSMHTLRCPSASQLRNGGIKNGSFHNIAQLPAHMESQIQQSPLTAAFDSAKQGCQTTPEVNSSSHVTEALQVCLLLLPPSNRSKLRLLLRLMMKICNNPHLADLDESLSTRTFMLRRLSPCILNSMEDVQSNELAERLVNFLLDHSAIILNVPTNLQQNFKQTMDSVRETQASVVSHQTFPRRALQRQITFCRQVSKDEYETQRISYLQSSLQELLKDIVNNQSMTMKEKKKKIKQFQKSYPEIYKSVYPSEEPVLVPVRKQQKFTNALKRLRSIRS